MEPDRRVRWRRRRTRTSTSTAACACADADADADSDATERGRLHDTGPVRGSWWRRLLQRRMAAARNGAVFRRWRWRWRDADADTNTDTSAAGTVDMHDA